MPSRMSRYHGNTRASSSRCERNEELYKNLYQTSNYSNISAVATLEKTNEIEIEKIRKMIRDRETYKKQKEIATIYPKEEKKEIKSLVVPDLEERNYDIRDVLTKAKEERKSENESYKKNQYDYLLNSKNHNRKKEIQNEETVSSELKEIINTITSNADLNKLSNSELSLDLLNDLKSNTIHNGEIENDAIRKIIEEEKRREEKLEAEKNIEMDKSFYTTNLGFSDKDFESEDDNFIKESKKSGLAVKIILAVVLVLITIVTIYVIYINIKSI